MASFDVKLIENTKHLRISFRKGDVESFVEVPFDFLKQVSNYQTIEQYRKCIDDFFPDARSEDEPGYYGERIEETETTVTVISASGEVDFQPTDRLINLRLGVLRFGVWWIEGPVYTFDFSTSTEDELPYGETIALHWSDVKNRIPTKINLFSGFTPEDITVFPRDNSSESSPPDESFPIFCITKTGRGGYQSEDFNDAISSYSEGLEFFQNGLIWSVLSFLER